VHPQEIHTIRTHDLLELGNPLVTPAGEDESTAPEWVQSVLAATPFVVVRRGYPSAGQIPIGVRGAERRHRWAGFTSLENVKRVLTPGSILSEWRRKDFQREINAFLALRAVLERWHSIDYEWGPGGSLGFELATGRATATQDSDLDLVLYAPDIVPLATARYLHSSILGLAARVDVLIETPRGGFALREYVDAHGAAILLRTPSGPVLRSDPWGTDSSRPHTDTDLRQTAADVLGPGGRG
jgi:phosphoribosyl-dephospho-CoA transferase